MEISIKNLKGDSLRLNVSGDMTIARLKKKYAELYNEGNNCQFKFSGQVLKDDKTLEYYEIEDGDIIIANSNYIAGGGIKIFIADSRNNITSLFAQGNMTIAMLKKKYSELCKESKESNEFIFMYNGEILEDNNTLDYYEIREGDKIIVIPSFRAGGL